MKNSITRNTILALLLCTVAFTSCIKEKDYEPVQIAGLSIINAAPTTTPLVVYADNNITTPANFIFGTKVDYLNAYAGSRNFTITKSSSTAAVYSERFTLENQVGYSLFVVDRLENLKFLFLKDDLAAPATGKAKLRFVNLSPDANALSLTIEGKPTAIFTNKAYKEFTSFEQIDAADKVTFQVKNNATGALETALPDVKIEAGKIYTIYAKGLKANTDDTKFGAAIFTHK
jgi:hypothetical protein